MRINSSYNNFSFEASKYREVQVLQNGGIHIRPSGYIAKMIKTAESDEFINSPDVPKGYNKDNSWVKFSVNGNEPQKIPPSIIAIMTMEIHKNDKVKIIVDEHFPDVLLDTFAKSIGAKDTDECLKIAHDFLMKHSEDERKNEAIYHSLCSKK